MNVLRPPIGDGFAGRIYAVALEPTGKTLVFGGWFGSETSQFFYALDLATNRLRRIGPVADKVVGLAFSPQGDRLAVTLKGGKGLTVWDTRTWRLLKADSEYFNNVDTYGAAFDKLGNLLTASRDGFLRRYTAQSMAAEGTALKPTKKKTHGGALADGLALHPAEDRVAVSYSDSTVVDVYNPRTLERLFSTAKAGDGGFWRVSWSARGERLYAAGNYKVGQKEAAIRVWRNRGRGTARDLITGSSYEITDLGACSSGVAFAAADPSFGVFDGAGKRTVWQPSVIPDQRGKLANHFTVSEDGTRVRFGLQQGGLTPVLFDLKAEQLVESDEIPPDLHQADAAGISATDWLNKSSPTLDGKTIALEPNEVVRALAASPDKTKVLGTSFRLRAFDAEGKPLWPAPPRTPGITWGLNIAAKGKLLVGAYGDGTVRWHRLPDGQELLALFVHAQDRRWIVWTPKGYYMASAGGEDLIGWHVNSGVDKEADWYPASVYRDRFYRPDIVRRILANLDEKTSIDEANRFANRPRAIEDISGQKAPVLSIHWPRNGSPIDSETVTLQFSVRSPSGLPLKRVVARLDHAPAIVAGEDFPTGKAERRGIITVPIPPRDVTIHLAVETEAQSASEAKSVRLYWTGRVGTEPLPALYAVIVGVAKYDGSNAKELPFALNDAKNFEAALRNGDKTVYRNIEVKALPDATGVQIIDALVWLKETVNARDKIGLFYFSGHGVTETTGGASYVLPSDYNGQLGGLRSVLTSTILDILSGSGGTVLIFLDACQSGGAIHPSNPTVWRILDAKVVANDFGRKSFITLASSTSAQESIGTDQSYFTTVVVEGMKGAAARQDQKVITVFDVAEHVRKILPGASKNRQTPVLFRPTDNPRDVPIARID